MASQHPVVTIAGAQSPKISGVVTGQTDLPSSVADGSVTNTTGIFYGALLP